MATHADLGEHQALGSPVFYFDCLFLHRDYETVREAVRKSKTGQHIRVAPGENIWFGRASTEPMSRLRTREIQVYVHDSGLRCFQGRSME